MKKLETDILINATPTQVWSILMNFDSYPTWNPFIQQISGSTAMGSKLSVQIKSGDEKSMLFKPKVLVCVEEKEFRWLGHLFVRGLFDGAHYFKLVPVGQHQTQFVHGENFRGLLAGLLLKIAGRQTLAGFRMMNEALKERAER